MTNICTKLKGFFTGKGLNLSEVERECGFGINTLRKSFDRGSEIGSEKLVAILQHYPEISAEWLLRGDGDMLNKVANDNIREINDYTPIYKSTHAEMNVDREIINLYDIDAAANLKTLLVESGQNILGRIMIPNAPKCDGALYVRGDSMYPLLKSGDIVAYKEVPTDMRYIMWGEMYIVDLDVAGDSMLVVKYVQQSEKGDDYIKLVSYNQHHQPQDFHISCIRAIALVKLSIRMNTIK